MESANTEREVPLVGVYCVAYGEAARQCAGELIRTVHKYAGLPVCVVSDRAVPSADVFVRRKRRDPGGRWAKTRIWHLAPREWGSVLYLDADMLVRGPLDLFFQVLDDGWELVMTESPPECPTMRRAQRARFAEENAYTDEVLRGSYWPQMSGGAWAFRRCPATEKYLAMFHKEWKRYGDRDQQAMSRAWYECRPRTWLLPREWNWFAHHGSPSGRATIIHFATAARDWVVTHPGKSLWEQWRGTL